MVKKAESESACWRKKNTLNVRWYIFGPGPCLEEKKKKKGLEIERAGEKERTNDLLNSVSTEKKTKNKTGSVHGL